ncbi:MAG: MerR family transcriptional regulator [Rhizobacter sp.]|nr:MerR family transcriptional regulator [Chlorobiales bacterium]
MRIGELATKTGLSADTIRFYEKIGVIRAADCMRQKNNYRDYSEALVERLLLVKQAKSLGFTLQEISELTEAWEKNELSPAEKLSAIDLKLRQVNEKISELQQVEKYLSAKRKLLKAEIKSALKETCEVIS